MSKYVEFFIKERCGAYASIFPPQKTDRIQKLSVPYPAFSAIIAHYRRDAYAPILLPQKLAETKPVQITKPA